MPFTLGFDFGTASVRALVVDVKNGREMGGHTVEYRVITGTLPDGTQLKPAMALSDPAEYEKAMCEAARGALANSGVGAEEIIGVGVDTTSCSMLAMDDDGKPLCLQEKFRSNPHAWIKLWKSHSAEKEAARAYQVAKERNEEFLHWVGEHISSEWLIPKALETFNDAPDVFAATAHFMDLPDYITFRLCGRYTANIGSLCFKELGMHDELPSAEYLNAVAPGFEVMRDKLAVEKFIRWGEKAGELTEEAAAMLGLTPGIAVAGGSLDGNVPVASLGLYKSGDLLLTLGTSGVLALLNDEAVCVKGVAGANQDTYLPGFIGYEAGMAAMGDLYAWVTDKITPAQYEAEAEKAGMNIHAYLSKLSLERDPRPEDIIALDWLNGHRGPLPRADVKGVLVGLTLDTTAVDIYRAMVEAAAFCVRLNLENIENQGVPAKRIILCGGIARKNPALVQLICDVLGRELLLTDSKDTAALGAAVLAANAAGAEGTTVMGETSMRMAAPVTATFTPNLARKAIFDQRYARYVAIANAMQPLA